MTPVAEGHGERHSCRLLQGTPPPFPQQTSAKVPCQGDLGRSGCRQRLHTLVFLTTWSIRVSRGDGEVL